jgi:hypothetical protein
MAVILQALREVMPPVGQHFPWLRYAPQQNTAV